MVKVYVYRCIKMYIHLKQKKNNLTVQFNYTKLHHSRNNEPNEIINIPDFVWDILKKMLHLFWKKWILCSGIGLKRKVNLMTPL